MNNSFIHLLLWLYRNLKRTGLFNYAWAESTFIFSYFAYKKYLEDTSLKLVKNYPQLFNQGHILDIGANIGYTAYVFSKALSSPYQIFAFEPEEYNLSLLNKVAQKFGLLDKLIITAAAVGEKEGDIDLWRNENHHADHRILTDELRKQLNHHVKIQKTRLITIDHFLQEKKAIDSVAFIKIDVQGYELAVCQGMQQTLAMNPHCVIEFEYCPAMMESLGYQPNELIEFFQNKEYLFYTFNKRGILSQLDASFLTPQQMKKKSLLYFDILCSKKELLPKLF